MVDLAVVAVGVAVAVPSLYLVLLAVAALFQRVSPPVGERVSRLVVLVPAYNEADYIGRCVASLFQQDYPSELSRVVVIADNCTDDTAAIAAAAGAEVLVRRDLVNRGKGQALRWAMDLVLARSPAPDAVVVVDADSVCDRHLLAGLAARLEAGAQAVQGEYLMLHEQESARSDLRGAALLLFHRVRFGGRAVLHMPCNMVGNGMLFSRALLEQHPWDAFTGAEDLEYSVGLRLAGIRPVFAGEARLQGPIATGGRAMGTQQRRWTGGRFYIVRTRLPSLVAAMLRRRDLSLLDEIVDLATPPLGLLTAVVAAGTVLGGLLFVAGAISGWALVPWLVALAAIPVFVLVGFLAARCPASMYRSLALAPLVVGAQLLAYVPLFKGLGHHGWERTERPSEVPRG